MEENKQKQANTWKMLCHLTGLCCYVGIPLGNLIGPLVIWLLKKEEFPEVDKHGKESLNFQISMLIYAVVAGFLCLIFIGFFLLIGLVIAHIVLTIKASIAASNGEDYEYPYTIRFIK